MEIPAKYLSSGWLQIANEHIVSRGESKSRIQKDTQEKTAGTSGPVGSFDKWGN